ncbi:hypothetical protein D187_009763 [Cystobacter fuscus DSM 2262]|uniref:Uncharacterized protein n=2 Tax=Cystobacter fuscus TaxID=43 RepID=S9QEZ9_CYSF2|nr:hypothetical protein D187_009763 [Cystobacter fuscus DSM 2262]
MFEVFARESIGVLRQDLRSWALQVMLAGLSFEARIAERNKAIRAAADFLPADMPTSERARQLHAELCAVSRSTRPSHPDVGTMRGGLALALLARDRVPDVQQVRRVLDEDCL